MIFDRRYSRKEMSKQFMLRRICFTPLIQFRGFSSPPPSVLPPPPSSSLFKKELCSVQHTRLTTRLVHSSLPVFSGHNRWSKIHRNKSIADHERSVVIAKFRQRIVSVVQSGGGPDLDNNARLGSVISQARAAGMSKSQIEGLLKPEVTKVQKEHIVYEARAPVGYLILLEVLTDNKNRVRAALKLLLTKKGCTMGDNGSSLFNFDHKGIVRVPCKELLTSNLDPLELAIEVGAEDVTTDSDDSKPWNKTTELDSGGQTEELKDDECYQFKCEPRDLTLVSKAIKGKSFTVVSASLEYIPKSLVKLSVDMFDKAEDLMKLLGEQDDVLEVHDNFTLDEQGEE